MKIALVCTHGGHLTETLQLLTAFTGHEVFFATHHSPRDQFLENIAPAYLSRSIDAKLVRMIHSFYWAYNILIKEKPQVILSMGAEIAIPFMLWAKLFKMKTIYIESWCRTKSISLTGKILYPIVDEFWVQWPELLSKCGPKAQYHGAVI